MSSEKKFSELYLQVPDELKGSKRAKRRLGALFACFMARGSLRDRLENEIGCSLPHYGCATRDYWPETVSKMDAADILDAITVIARSLNEWPRNKSEFISDVRKIFIECQLRYTIDDSGAVHLRLDAPLEQSRSLALGSLLGPRYENVRQNLSEAYAHVGTTPQNCRDSMRSVFSAMECLFRLVFPGSHQLGVAEIKKRLTPLIDQRYSKDSTALRASQKQLAQLCAWVEGAHFYRHEPGVEIPSPPPIEMTLQYLHSGASWLRWLQSFDTQ